MLPSTSLLLTYLSSRNIFSFPVIIHTKKKKVFLVHEKLPYCNKMPNTKVPYYVCNKTGMNENLTM